MATRGKQAMSRAAAETKPDDIGYSDEAIVRADANVEASEVGRNARPSQTASNNTEHVQGLSVCLLVDFSLAGHYTFRMKKMPNAYWAGLMDGEGCITIIRRVSKKHHYGECYYLTVRVTMTDRGATEVMHRQFGGTYTEWSPSKSGYNKNWADWFIWTCSGPQAVEFIRKVQPWLLVKGHQARVALRFQKTFSGWKRSKRTGHTLHVPKRVHELRTQLWKEMSFLNARGRKAQLDKAANSGKPVTDNAVGNPEPTRRLAVESV